MPLYEYECKSCDSIVEVLVRTPQDGAKCPDCGDQKIDRILSVPASHAVKSGSSLAGR